jgi:hypothetical protein
MTIESTQQHLTLIARRRRTAPRAGAVILPGLAFPKIMEWTERKPDISSEGNMGYFDALASSSFKKDCR